MSELDKYIEYKTILAINVFIVSQGKILLLKRAANKLVDPGKYSGVGGKVEPGESFLAAAIREVAEETEIIVTDNIRPYAFIQTPDLQHDVEWVIAGFIVEVPEQVEIPTSEDGVFEWKSFGDIDGLDILEDAKTSLDMIRTNSKGLILGMWNYDEKGRVVSKKFKIF